MIDPCSVYLLHAHRHIGALGAIPLKVGISSAPKGRLDALQTAHHEALTIAAVWQFDSRPFAAAVERTFHRRNAGAHLRGEWFLTWANGAAHEVEEIAFEAWRAEGQTNENIRRLCDAVGIDRAAFREHLGQGL